MPRVVLDVTVLISGLIWGDGAPARLLAALRLGAFEIVVSPLLLAELAGVLGREKFRPYVAEKEVETYLAQLRAAAVMVDDLPLSDPLSDDPKDDYLVALAQLDQVDALVSGDVHLLRLRPTVPVLSPREFLESLS